MSYIRPIHRNRLWVLACFAVACANDPNPGGGGEKDWPVVGRLETIVFEGPQGATRHFLVPDDGSDAIELDFAVDPTAGSGARIGVDGRYDGTRFRVTSFNDQLAPAGDVAIRQSALDGVTPEKMRTVAFVMVDYGMGVNVTRAEAQTFMFSTTNPGPQLGIDPMDKSTLQFYDETSY